MQHNKNWGLFFSLIFSWITWVFIKGSISGTARRKRARWGGRAQSAHHASKCTTCSPAWGRLHFLKVCTFVLRQLFLVRITVFLSLSRVMSYSHCRETVERGKKHNPMPLSPLSKGIFVLVDAMEQVWPKTLFELIFFWPLLEQNSSVYFWCMFSEVSTHVKDYRLLSSV